MWQGGREGGDMLAGAGGDLERAALWRSHLPQKINNNSRIACGGGGEQHFSLRRRGNARTRGQHAAHRRKRSGRRAATEAASSAGVRPVTRSANSVEAAGEVWKP